MRKPMFCRLQKSFVLPILATIIFPVPVQAVELNNPLAPIARPQNAPLPHAHYGVPRPNRNYKPEQTNPGGPTYKLDTGPDINHQQWCSDRYRSYRSSDDTYVDRGGVRQTCKSPFPK
ncbi:BA14K family protein [Bartonella sp. W8125]|nr:BA14K family protein [Bartonella choladocola]